MKRVFARLLDEHGMTDVSYQVVRAYVATRKPEIRVEAGRGPVNVFISQTHRPGVEAEVDFGEVAVRLRGEQVPGRRPTQRGQGVHMAPAPAQPRP